MKNSNQPFWTGLSEEVLAHCFQRRSGNVDPWRYPQTHPFQRKLKDAVLKVSESLGFCREPPNYSSNLQQVIKQVDGFDRTMALLADNDSRELLVKLMAYRILGARHYSLPMNTPSYWQMRSTIPGFVKRKDVVNDVPYFGSLDEFEYADLRVVAHPLIILNTFMVEQYRCCRAGIGVREGDIVIDGGACWGDTSVYFARKASRVFAYECVPFNLAVFQRNMELNPELASRITLVPKALWASSGETLGFAVDGSASRASAANRSLSVETHTIDDLVRERKLNRVDFIKMDIEGAETNALLGAEQTIRRFRPRLAICVYHSLQDFIRIPQWIASLNLGYRLYLDHFTIYSEESILFAECPRARSGDGHVKSRV